MYYTSLYSSYNLVDDIILHTIISMAVKQKLKIGVVVDQLLAGGVQLCAIEQVKHLNKLGHKAKLLILMRKKYSKLMDNRFCLDLKNIPGKYNLIKIIFVPYPQDCGNTKI